MIKFTWILLSCSLVLCSFQQPLPPHPNTVIDQEDYTVSSKPNVAEVATTLTTTTTGGFLSKRAPPPEPITEYRYGSVRDLQDALLEKFDSVEHDNILPKTKERKRKVALEELLQTVPYDSSNQRGYIDSVHNLLGEARVDQHRIQISKTMSTSVPTEDRERIQKLFHQLRNKRARQRKRLANKEEKKGGEQSNPYQDVNNGNIEEEQNNQDEQDIHEYPFDNQHNSHGSFHPHDQIHHPVHHQSPYTPMPLYNSNHHLEYLHGHGNGQDLHIHPRTPETYPSPVYWPQHASLGSSSSHIDDYNTLDEVDQVASMFQDMPGRQV